MTGHMEPEAKRTHRTMLALIVAVAGLCAGAIASPASPATAQDSSGDDVTITEQHGGGWNVVVVHNRQNAEMRVRGNVDLNIVPGDTAAPVNYAAAVGSCANCQTYAVALQIDLIRKTANVITPRNTALALNYGCTRCLTVAHAIQFVVQVDDPAEVPEGVREAMREFERELREIAALARQRRITVIEADGRINALLDRFRELGTMLLHQREETTEVDSP